MIWLRFLPVAALLPGPLHQTVRWFRRHARQTRTRYVYRIFSGVTRIRGVHFLNYGYAPLVEDSPIQLEPADEPDRVFIQLYHRVVGQVDLSGRDVLEVSCGHGGGASYVARYLQPASMTAVDLNPRAIQMCRDTIRVAGLEFQVANALELPFEGCSFDAVLNVEASHCYPCLATFLTEVRRVLRPNGRLLFADVRWDDSEQEAMKQALAESELEIVDFEDITQDVVAALERYAHSDCLRSKAMRVLLSSRPQTAFGPTVRALTTDYQSLVIPPPAVGAGR